MSIQADRGDPFPLSVPVLMRELGGLTSSPFLDPSVGAGHSTRWAHNFASAIHSDILLFAECLPKSGFKTASTQNGRVNGHVYLPAASN